MNINVGAPQESRTNVMVQDSTMKTILLLCVVFEFQTIGTISKSEQMDLPRFAERCCDNLLVTKDSERRWENVSLPQARQE